MRGVSTLRKSGSGHTWCRVREEPRLVFEGKVETVGAENGHAHEQAVLKSPHWLVAAGRGAGQKRV